MSVTAIIAEYNPMHRGHEYLIEEAKRKTGADYALIVMSSNFVQRGAPAVMNKYLRTSCALKGGADLVIELPTYYSLSSAEYFAKGAVALIDSLGSADTLCFGVECDDIDLLYELAEIPVFEKSLYNELITSYLDEGLSYAKSESTALLKIALGDTDSLEVPSDRIGSKYTLNELEQILSSPNNTLAISYIRALIELDSPIKAVCIKRVISDYNDESLGALSSSAVRKEIIDGNYPPLKNQLSPEIYDYLKPYNRAIFPVSVDDFSDILMYKLMDIIYGSGNSVKTNGILKLTEYVDVSSSLAARIINNLSSYKSFSQFVAILKTKDTTYTRISRALMHIILNIKKSNMQKYINNDFSLYARILGFREDSGNMLAMLKHDSMIPIISKLADADKIIDNELTLKLLNENTFASELYDHVVASKFGSEFVPEYSRPIIVL